MVYIINERSLNKLKEKRKKEKRRKREKERKRQREKKIRINNKFQMTIQMPLDPRLFNRIA